jgi:hypothetical protein
MSGSNEIDDPEVSDGASENEYSDQDPDLDVVKEGDDNSGMAEQKIRPETDENGKAVGGSTVTTTKPKLDPKDPLRPRRKKARRACFACQRAHLTCGMFAFLRIKLLWFSFLLQNAVNTSTYLVVSIN